MPIKITKTRFSLLFLCLIIVSSFILGSGKIQGANNNENSLVPKSFIVPFPGLSSASTGLDIPFGDSRLNYVNVADDNYYNSSPGMVKLNNSTLMVVYRKGQYHSKLDPLDKGSIVTQTSNDFGRTWSNQSTVYADTTKDARDPSITKLSDDTLIISFTKYPLSSVYVIKSNDNGATWGSPIAVTSNFTTFTAVAAPVVELSNGKLLISVYGKNAGETYSSVHTLTSSDKGNTWGNEVIVANGQSAKKNYAELNVVQLANGNLLGLIRNETSNTIGATTSADLGATWSAVSTKFKGYGSPRVIQLSSGRLITVYRAITLDSKNEAALRISDDNGNTWTPDADEYFLDTTEISISGMEYASMVEVDKGLIGIIYSVELWSDSNKKITNEDNADVRFRYITEGWGVNPLGTLTGKGVVSYGGDITAVGGGIYLKSKRQLQKSFEVATSKENAYLNLYDALTAKKIHLDALGDSYFNGGNVGIGIKTPAAALHLKAGSAIANAAPLKFTAGTNLTTAEAGAMEYDGTNLYFTPSTARKTVAFTADIITAHSSMTGLDFASSGHTGFESSVTKGNLTAGSSKISIGGTGTGAIIGAGASVDVSESNITHNNLGGLTTGDPHTQYALLAGRSGGQTIIGGTGTTSDLYLQTTSGVGATGADMHFSVGNNGATEAMTILNSGSIGIGTTAPAQLLDISSTAPSFQMTDTSASAKSLRLVTNANLANFYEAAGSAGEIMTLDLANNRVGMGTTTITYDLDVDKSVDGHVTINSKNRNTGGRAIVMAQNDDQSMLKLVAYGTLATGTIFGLNKTDLGALVSEGFANGTVLGTFDNTPLYFGTNNATRATILGDGSIGIGTTSPTAVLHLKAGTATASTAPLKFSSGTNLTTAEAGAMEYDGTSLYFTPSGTTRKTIQYKEDSPNISSGTAAPSSTPSKVGDVYVDTTNHKVYISDGTTNSSNWVLLN